MLQMSIDSEFQTLGAAILSQYVSLGQAGTERQWTVEKKKKEEILFCHINSTMKYNC